MRFINKKIMLFMTNVFLLAGIGSTIANYSTSVIQGEATYTDLIISEYYESDGGTNKAFEIYNGTGSTVNLANYSIVTYINGRNYPDRFLNLTGNLLNSSTLTIYNSSTSRVQFTGITIEDNNIANFNGDDVISIYNNGGSPLSGTLGVSGTVNSDMADETLIDIIGVIGQDGNNSPTNDAFLFTSANNSVTSGSTKDRILVRSRSTTSPNTTFTVSEWMAFPVVTSASVGLLQPDSKTSSFGSHSSSTFDLIYAENYAYLFLNGTANKAANCTDAGLNWTSSLETNFNLLTANEKSAFTNNTNNSTNITNALARYNYLRTYTPSLSNFAGI
jgi:hypothetical protein